MYGCARTQAARMLASLRLMTQRAGYYASLSSNATSVILVGRTLCSGRAQVMFSKTPAMAYKVEWLNYATILRCSLRLSLALTARFGFKKFMGANICSVRNANMNSVGFALEAIKVISIQMDLIAHSQAHPDGPLTCSAFWRYYSNPSFLTSYYWPYTGFPAS